MSERSITITHNGTTYTGQVGRIRRTSFGIAEFGGLSATLEVVWEGGGVGVGGYALDGTPVESGGPRVPTLFGLAHLAAIMDTVGVKAWEDLPGRRVIVLFEGDGGWGSTAVGIAHISDDKVLVFEEQAAAYRGGASHG